jgi:hypothetical protein
MGRYYSGDIQGKFWFGAQSSIAANRFGVQHQEPSVVNYYFEQDNLEDVEQELKNIEESLGGKLKLLDDFMNDDARIGYTDNEILDLGISKEEFSEYADWTLGIKIRDCIKEQGSCEFEAEL